MADQTGIRPELADLQESVARLVAAAGSAPDVAGEWSPTLVLGHLSQVDREVWLPRVDQMVDTRHRGAASPSFSWWESAPGSVEATFSGHSLDGAAAELQEARLALVSRLASLSDDDWAAIAHHDVFGVIDVVGLVREVLAHDREHLGGLEG
jgi:DinB superfamily